VVGVDHGSDPNEEIRQYRLPLSRNPVTLVKSLKFKLQIYEFGGKHHSRQFIPSENGVYIRMKEK